MKRLDSLLITTLSLILASLYSISSLSAQTAIKPTANKSNSASKAPPTSIYYDKKGRVFIAQKEKLYLFFSTTDEPGAEKHQLRNKISYPASKPISSFQFEGHGEHSIVHPADHKNLQKTEDENIFPIFSDAIPPYTIIKATKAPSVTNGKRKIFGKPVKLSLKFRDKGAGVHSGYVDFDGAGYMVNTSPLSLEQEKDYTVKYYALDNVNNKSREFTRLYALDLTPPSTTPEIKGPQVDNIVSRKSLIILNSKDLKAGVDLVRYRIGGRRHVYSKPISLSDLKDGNHEVVYAAVDRVQNAEKNQTFKFYMDAIPPKVKSSISGDQHKKSKKQFVSGRTTFELSGTDNKAGVDQIYYYLESKKGKRYSDPFSLEPKNGPTTFFYNATDKVGNISRKFSKSVIVDVSPPKVSISFKGEQYFSRKIHYIRKSTMTSFYIKDNLSGVKGVAYILDQGQPVKSRKAFKIADEGEHIIKVNATDNVNNLSENSRYVLFVDETAPEIYPHFSVDKSNPNAQGAQKDIYPLKTKLFLAATDKDAGVKTVYYRINNGKEQVYDNPIQFNKKGKFNVKVRSVDNVGNVSKKDVKFDIQKF
ncbi:MAG: hypothetical protein OEY59_06190 [Deltaproteobacteria bacterium]|nr:hypothetical protein [Deltaproteobacteria bacterium]